METKTSAERRARVGREVVQGGQKIVVVFAPARQDQLKARWVQAVLNESMQRPHQGHEVHLGVMGNAPERQEAHWAVALRLLSGRQLLGVHAQGDVRQLRQGEALAEAIGLPQPEEKPGHGLQPRARGADDAVAVRGAGPHVEQKGVAEVGVAQGVNAARDGKDLAAVPVAQPSHVRLVRDAIRKVETMKTRLGQLLRQLPAIVDRDASGLDDGGRRFAQVIAQGVGQPLVGQEKPVLVKGVAPEQRAEKLDVGHLAAQHRPRLVKGVQGAPYALFFSHMMVKTATARFVNGFFPFHGELIAARAIFGEKHYLIST